MVESGGRGGDGGGGGGEGGGGALPLYGVRTATLNPFRFVVFYFLLTLRRSHNGHLDYSANVYYATSSSTQKGLEVVNFTRHLGNSINKHVNMDPSL